MAEGETPRNMAEGEYPETERLKENNLNMYSEYHLEEEQNLRGRRVPNILLARFHPKCFF